MTWTLENVAPGAEGMVTLTVKVLDSARKQNDGPGKVQNGGETSTVSVGNDYTYTVELIDNPVDDSTSTAKQDQPHGDESTGTNRDRRPPTAQTGDETPIVLLAVLLLLSGAGLFTLIIVKRRRKKNER